MAIDRDGDGTYILHAAMLSNDIFWKIGTRNVD